MKLGSTITVPFRPSRLGNPRLGRETGGEKARRCKTFRERNFLMKESKSGHDRSVLQELGVAGNYSGMRQERTRRPGSSLDINLLLDRHDNPSYWR